MRPQLKRFGRSLAALLLILSCCASSSVAADEEQPQQRYALSQENLKKLMAAFSHDDIRMRYDAVQTAQAYHVGQAVPNLIALLDGKLRWPVIVCLGKLRNSRATKALVKLLVDKNPNIRQAVVTALGKIGDRSATPALIDILGKDASMRSDVINALALIGDPRAIKPLTPLLEDKDPNTRTAAGRALCAIGGKDVLRKVATLLEDDSKGVRAAIWESLIRRTSDTWPISPKDQGRWLKKLEHKYPEVRAYAVLKLGYFGDKRVVKSIAGMLSDESRVVRVMPIAALDKLGTDEAISAVFEVVKNRKSYTHTLESAAVWCLAVDLLCRRKDLRTLEPLLSALDDESVVVYYPRERVLLGLGRLGGKHVMKELLKREECIWAAFSHLWYISALARLGDEESFIGLSKGVTAKKAKDRELTAELLGYTELQRAEPWLVRLLSDKYLSVQCLAAENLSTIPRPSKIAISALTKALQDKHRELRLAAANTLGGMGSTAKTAIPILAKMLKDENTDNEVKKAVAEALKKIKRSTTTKPNLTTRPAACP